VASITRAVEIAVAYVIGAVVILGFIVRKDGNCHEALDFGR
jgi:hypothetical protein